MGFCDVLLYINGIFCYVAGYSALSVTCGDSSPKGGAKAYPNTRIGAFLPLPSGEVAARSADGEGDAEHPHLPYTPPRKRGERRSPLKC